ncbi:hypothetical protein C2S52_022124 [Perilla frutescens var. hirtella]|nr:hypothetical protein C2S52_022124 [Perilla frutescens var. hirtella]
MMFNNILDGIEFYRRYAARCGFDVRNSNVIRSKDGTITWKYILCNRAGEKNAAVDRDANVDGVMDKRRRVSRRVRCRARIVLKFSGMDGYSIHSFEERHSHPLVCDKHKGFLKLNRNIGHVHQKFILDCVRANIGLMDSYKLYNEVAGGHCNIGCTKTDVKNFTHDLRAYIVGADAQMVIDNLFKRREVCSAFYFKYLVDGEDKLKHIFWADPICRRNFAVFGDSVSFDATYNTNRYSMIFTPFTRKDNHRKCVTFGAGLLSGENGESYAWLFEMFLKCMGHSPSLIITDQDLGMKTAIAQVFPNSRHRLCMWHIMLKLPEKIREFWIPAYFREFPMSGLCRTTSISESVNNFFNGYLHSRSNMLEFFIHFESAMDAQRHASDLQNSIDESSIPQLKTPLLLEKHAASVYTSHIFLKVQEEIMHSYFKCSVVEVNCSDPMMVYEADDGSKFTHTVTYNKVEDTFVCSYKKYIMEGLLCCHVFLLLKNMKAVEIPQKYIISRWTKTSLLKPLHSEGGALFDNCDNVGDGKNLTNQLVSEFYSTLGLVEGNDEKMKLLLASLQEFRSMLQLGDDEYAILANKKRLFEQFYGSSTPAEVDVHPPIPVKTKGSCSRLKPRQEAIAEKKKKPLRMCSRCHQKSDHDARNCKAVISA